jgi:hypothetical protein
LEGNAGATEAAFPLWSVGTIKMGFEAQWSGYGKYIDAASFKASVFHNKCPELLPIIRFPFGLKEEGSSFLSKRNNTFVQ